MYTSVFIEDAFSRLDESSDAVFYSKDRFVSHLDSTALSTIEDLIGTLVTAEKPVILDLMASWDSHIPKTVKHAKVIGLGLNANELSSNDVLSEYVIYDLNEDPELPFNSETFDVVLCTVSVDYMTQPIRVFQEVGRILKPGGLYLVIFSNRMFPPKVVKIWRDASEEERIRLVQDLFDEAGLFNATQTYISTGKPRPVDDKYASLGIPCDPVYAVYAYKKEVNSGQIYYVDEEQEKNPLFEEVERKKQEVKETLCCPYCSERLQKWQVPQTIFTEWPNEYLYVCFNDNCSYFRRGWQAMATQGNTCSYRLMYDPITNSCGPIPVFNRTMLKDSIIKD
ncbi:MAG: methyltransferase domain-containing protein [Dehalococcoidia bacterium]|nr:MAG: methyltransferase domain-containing protein [Dehalococcoidia bacterium]